MAPVTLWYCFAAPESAPEDASCLGTGALRAAYPALRPVHDVQTTQKRAHRNEAASGARSELTY